MEPRLVLPIEVPDAIDFSLHFTRQHTVGKFIDDPANLFEAGHRLPPIVGEDTLQPLRRRRLGRRNRVGWIVP